MPISACAEKDVIDSLNHLEQWGVVQRKNRMDIDELLNPAMEKQLVGEGVLASFGRHVFLEDSRAMRATQITDYSACK